AAGEPLVQVRADERVGEVLHDDRLPFTWFHPVDDRPVLGAHVVKAALAVVERDGLGGQTARARNVAAMTEPPVDGVPPNLTGLGTCGGENPVPSASADLSGRLGSMDWLDCSRRPRVGRPAPPGGSARRGGRRVS